MSSSAALVREVRQEILRQLSEAHAHMNQSCWSDRRGPAVFEAAPRAAQYVIKGETNLMDAELTGMEKLGGCEAFQ